MKKIFYILMSAVVALGAVACENAFDDNNLGTNDKESLSIEVEISEATRVALFDNGKDADGKQTYKLGFEDGDQLLVTTAWGGDTTNPENNFWFTYSEESGLFTCETEGVSALKGQKRSVFYLATHPEKGLVGGVLCDSEAGIDGILMTGSTSALGEEKIGLTAYPVLKYTSEHPVTFTSSKAIFGAIRSWGIGQYGKESDPFTCPAGTDVYVPIFSYGEITLSASIKGEVVKEKTFNFERNKIYNLGTLEALPEPEEQPVDGDAAGIAITIDGDFADWANITKNVATLPADATATTGLKTFKAYTDANNIYGYVELAIVEDNVKFVMGVNLDNDDDTGKGNWLLTNVKGCEFVVTSGTFIENNTWALYSGPFNWATAKLNDVKVGEYAKDIVTSSKVIAIADGIAAVEFAIAREQLNDSMTSPNIGLGISTYGIGDKKLGTLPYADNTALVIPVYN